MIQQICAESLGVSGSVLSAGYTKMPTAATQGLTEPMKKVSEVAGTCLTCSKNKLEGSRRNNRSSLFFASLFIQLYRSRALSSMPRRLKSAGREVEGLVLWSPMWDPLYSPQDLSSSPDFPCPAVPGARPAGGLYLCILSCDTGYGNSNLSGLFRVVSSQR